jgi:hypothetical protein
MSTNQQQAQAEELWRQALRDYREEGLQVRLADGWPGDGSVNGRISYGYPPTFQPGYVGPRYLATERRIVLVGQNPGEGSDPDSKRMNREYRAKLEAFLGREIDFKDVNGLIASHMLRWRIFKGKGIFREGGAGRVALLADGVSPSIEEVSYMNYFPFKTSENRPPLKASAFRPHLWTTYVARLLELLEPSVIAPMGAWISRSVVYAPALPSRVWVEWISHSDIYETSSNGPIVSERIRQCQKRAGQVPFRSFRQDPGS